jgi:outer membrane protein assembly factor BamE (lipoprotein component of BamABCDE complex)
MIARKTSADLSAMRQTAFTFIAAAALSVSLASCSNKKTLPKEI